MAYTKEEKLEIQKTMSILLNEINELYEKSNKSRIKIQCPNIYGLGRELYKDDWYLDISSSKIKLFNSYAGRNCAEVGPFRLDKFLKKGIIFSSDYIGAAAFISNYDGIKNKLRNEISKELNRRDSLIEEMQRIQEEHSSDVEIDFPESMIYHEIEISHKDGKTIGTIYFGSQIVRIITRGDVVIIDGDKREGFQKRIGRKS